ncbi:MAG: hypothetical protein EXQ94_04945 [Alphaproteobacteria bacterium]|nr:hypothetical protein [Alphaproteobacteria bacterium]
MRGSDGRGLVNVPRDRVRMHVCWGNYEGPHDRDVDLKEIPPRGGSPGQRTALSRRVLRHRIAM